jgi:hypothetical protein
LEKIKVEQEILKKEAEEKAQKEILRSEKFQRCLQRFALKLCKYQTKKLVHYAKKIHNQIKFERQEKKKQL